MSTEKLTTDYVLSELKGFYSGNKSGNGSGYPKRLLNTFLAREVEQQTKQLREKLEKYHNSNYVLGEGWRRLKEERDKAVDLLGHANRILCHEIDIQPYGPFHDLLTSFLNQLNQNNEG